MVETNTVISNEMATTIPLEIPLPNAPFLSITTAVSLELCCGSAGLSAAMHAVGFDALGIDFIRNPSKPKSAVLSADLSSSAGQSLVVDILDNSCVQYGHGGPPCGTASRAREKRIPLALIKQGAPTPRQLRSELHPLGLPNLSPNESMRVNLANQIYFFFAAFFLRLHNSNILWTLENPLRSYFWLIPGIVFLLSQPGVYLVIFQQCCHGGERPVWRQWATNCKALLRLNATCQCALRGFVHAPFEILRNNTGKWNFDTASEAAYPLILCRRVAQIIYEAVLAKGFLPLPLDISQADAHPATKRQRRRASVGLFVRGNKLPQMVSEFGEVITMQLSGGNRVGSTIQLSDSGKVGKVIRRIEGVNSESSTLRESDTSYAVGVFRSPELFLQQAAELRHPIDLESSLPDILKKNIFWALTTTASEINAFRLNQLKLLRQLVHNTAEPDAAIFRTMSPQNRVILQGKKFSALRIILQQADYDDVAIVDEIIAGIPLVGPYPKSHIFPPKLRSASITVDQLRSGSKWMRRGIIPKIQSSGDTVVDEKVWLEALEERDKGWLSGPFTESQLQEKFPEGFVVSRRFGLKQAGKIRSIDDFSESLVNSAISTFEQIELMGVDDFVAVVKLVAESISTTGDVSIKLQDQTFLKGRLPPGIAPADAKRWLGKTFDLKSAYKQLASRSKDSWATVTAVFCPVDGLPRFFIQSSLPFGAVGSVMGFNRGSRALWAAMSHWLKITTTVFYDDFPVLEPQATSLACDISVRAFFVLMGWTISLEPKKNKPFSTTFDMLGVTMDLTNLSSDLLCVENKKERVISVSELIDHALSLPKCPAPLTAEIKGKCQFAANQMFGRVATGPLHQMSVHQFRCHSGIIGNVFRDALNNFKALLNNTIPRQLRFHGEAKPILIFSDGACEGSQRGYVTVGAVCYDTVDKSSLMFGTRVDQDVVAFWQSEGNIQTIGQAELLPVLMARTKFQEKLRHRRVFVFVDNDAARHGLIKGCSDSFASDAIIRRVVQLDATSQNWIWYARVPSASNPGDGPSRLRLIPHSENLFSDCVEAPYYRDIMG